MEARTKFAARGKYWKYVENLGSISLAPKKKEKRKHSGKCVEEVNEDLMKKGLCRRCRSPRESITNTLCNICRRLAIIQTNCSTIIKTCQN